jgi:hypothetical protein
MGYWLWHAMSLMAQALALRPIGLRFMPRAICCYAYIDIEEES